MKKLIVLLMAIVMVLGLGACKKKELSDANNAPVTDETKNNTEEKPIAIDDVKEIFLNDPQLKDFEITDCVLANDKAYGLWGIVQYTDDDGNSTWLAFVNEDYAHPVNLDATGKLVIADNSVLTYIGNGAVVLTLENPSTGDIYDYTMVYSYDENINHVNFTASSNIRK